MLFSDLRNTHVPAANYDTLVPSYVVGTTVPLSIENNGSDIHKEICNVVIHKQIVCFPLLVIYLHLFLSNGE